MNRHVPLFLPESRWALGTYVLTVDVASPIRESAFDEVLSKVQLLAAAGECGAFPAAATSPLQTRFGVGNALVYDERQLTCHVSANGVDLNAFELLRNMSDRLTRKDIDVRKIELAPVTTALTPTRRKPVPTDESEFEAYPAVSPLVRCVLQGEAGEVGKMRRCLVDLTVGVEVSHITRMAEWVDPWFGLLEAGAFSMPVGPAQETESIRGSVALFDEQAIEITVDRFQASETAWHALINMLDACWATPLILKVLVD
jgi:hypothetical protein